MAKKINRAAVKARPEPVNELEVLHPERHLTLRGRKVVVREYGHVEWLRLLPRAEPLVAAIAAGLQVGREPTYEEALGVLVDHVDALMPLVHQAADLDDAAQQLGPEEGELLLMTWWGVNGRFFVSRALNRVAVARAEVASRQEALQARQAAASDGGASTPPSARTTTAEKTSPATPSGS